MKPATEIESSDAEVIVAAVDNLAVAVNKCWLDFSPEAQSRALELETCLCFLRRKIINVAAMPNDQKLSHAAGDSRQPEIRSEN